MIISLRIENFRCFEQAELRPCPGFNFFVGPNAAGKTSLLEALCVLLRLQSPRTSSPGKCVRFGAPGFDLDGKLEDRRLGCRWAGGIRSLTMDSVPQSRSAQYLSVGRITWFSNSDLELIRGSGAGRRKYLDFLGSQLDPGYGASLRAYERALRSRNFLLREERPRREIDAYTPPLVEHGNRLLAVRARLFPLLAAEFAGAADEIAGRGEDASIAYVPGCGERSFDEALAASMDSEIRLRQTCVGPHRDDFDLCAAGRPSADFASEGQQRTFALALKLAQARLIARETGDAPVLLLDDIFGELDPARRNQLLAALPGQTQKFVTTTFLDWWKDADQAGDRLISCLKDGRISST